MEKIQKKINGKKKFMKVFHFQGFFSLVLSLVQTKRHRRSIPITSSLSAHIFGSASILYFSIHIDQHI